jgi:hypothetical protein
VRIIFVGILLALLVIWSRTALARNWSYQVLVSAHAIVVILIFALLQTIELVVDLLPEYFFDQLFKLLTALNIIGAWYYILIVLGIGAALALVSFIQRSIRRSAEARASRIGADRASQKQCWSCGSHLLDDADHCIVCGKKQRMACPHCGKSTPIKALHCPHCGEGLEK